MSRRFLVQVEEGPLSGSSNSSQAAQSVSSNSIIGSAGRSRRLHTRVDIEEDPPDLMQKHQEQVKEQWRQEQLENSREIPQVQPLRSTKEEAFQAQPIPEGILNRQKVPVEEKGYELSQSSLQKIEGFYRQQNDGSDDELPSGGLLSKFAGNFHHHQRKLSLFLILLAIVGVVISSYFFIKSDIRNTELQAQSLMEDIAAGRITSANERFKLVSGREKIYRQGYNLVRPAVLLVEGEEKTDFLDQSFALADQAVSSANQGLKLYSDLEDGYQQFVGSKEGKSTETAQRLSGEFEGLYNNLSEMQVGIQKLNNPYNLDQIDTLKEQGSKQLPIWRRYSLAAQKISQSLPQILADGSEKRYMILLQNNAELRPTGGFIGSFALITIRDGKLADFTVKDVYEADGQLQGFVAPPVEITQYLGEAQWHLRDVNWSPDFPKVATRAEWFLDKSLNTKVDGVFAINLEVAKRLLAATGPIQLVDYNEVVTPDTLYQQAETHSELNFFPGSTQKKDFLSAVAQQLLDKVFHQQTNKLALAQALVDSAENSELFMNFNDTQVQSVISTLGWDGALLTPPCPSPFNAQNCQIDTVMQVEANVGVNKANQFITRRIDHKVELTDDTARHTRVITWTNTAQSEAWPAGKYKDYMRLFVPQGSVLRGATLNGQPLDLTQVKQDVEDDKQIFGFLVEVPIKSSATLEVFYETPLKPGYGSYGLFEQKQSGVEGDKVEHIIDVGTRDVATVAPEPTKIDGRQIIFDDDHTKHEFMMIQMK